MRKLIFAINLTMDGCCDHTKGGGGDEEMHAFYAQLLRESDTFVYGRKTFELMVPFWPDIAKNNSGGSKATNDFAQAFDSVKEIVVFSRSLKVAEQKNVRIVDANLKEEILKLKQQEGKSILAGGVDLPSQLIDLGLVDEYYFVIQPVLVGQGRRLLEQQSLQEDLQLIETRTFKSGSVLMHFTKRSS